ncbi:hypothetical protein QQX13_12140 [Demequina sp. SYSU T00068]|uniref:hypothetical protein n=1 Tax=Demequina lignilytica TaxID=3051663 RepID=UPI00261E4DCE|nr:hypothetical protein [Demequina sp. SYSU T00068]MDN4491584.1 hypothetical protein [Demequina sp. SYSU T00068]
MAVSAGSDLELVERSIGHSLSDIEDAARHGNGVLDQLLPQERAAQTRELLSEARRARDVTARPSELAPALYDVEGNYSARSMGIGLPPPRNSVPIAHIRHALLFSHRVHLIDPIAQMFDWQDKVRNREFWGLVVRQTLRDYRDALPLVDAGTVQLHAPPNGVLHADISSSAVQDSPEFLRFTELVVDGGAPTTVLDVARLRASLWRARHDPIARARLSVALLFEGFGEWRDELVDLNRQHYAQIPGADTWFPTAEHARYHSGAMHLLSQGNLSRWKPTDTFEQMLLQIQIPSLNQLAGAEIVKIRADAEVFDAWRGAMSEVLSEVYHNGLRDKRAIAAARGELAGLARDLRRKAGPALGKLFTGAMRGFALGTAAGLSYNMAMSPAIDVASAAIPSAVGAAADAGTTAAVQAVGRTSAKAALRNVLIVSEALDSRA